MANRRPLRVLLLPLFVLGLAVGVVRCDARRRLHASVSEHEDGRRWRRELEPEQQAGAGGCRLKPFEDAGEGWQLKSADILVPGESGPDAFGPDFAWGAGAWGEGGFGFGCVCSGSIDVRFSCSCIQLYLRTRSDIVVPD